MPRKVSETVQIDAAPHAVCAYLDDFENVAAHMAGRSMALIDSRPSLHRLSDAHSGLGARYRWHGQVAGFDLDLTEVVTERIPDRQKTWETVEQPRLVIMSSYRVSFSDTRSS